MYCSIKSTGKETGKTDLCAVVSHNCCPIEFLALSTKSFQYKYLFFQPIMIHEAQIYEESVVITYVVGIGIMPPSDWIGLTETPNLEQAKTVCT